jgi:soluble lytic murein transglycosylase-like protein
MTAHQERLYCISVLAASMLLACLECRAEAAPSEARQALRVLCPRAVGLAPLFDHAANRHHLPASLLVSVAYVESSCNPRAVGPKGSVGLMQIMPGGSAAHGTPPAMLLLPAVSLRLASRHLARWLRVCHDMPAALGIYAGHRTCEAGRASGYAQRVLELVEQAKGAKS